MIRIFSVSSGFQGVALPHGKIRSEISGGEKLNAKTVSAAWPVRVCLVSLCKRY
jgi:predicted component of type VI protein secretion system